MEKLQEMVVELAIAKHKQPLSSSQISLIDQRLRQAFPLGLCTPNHPTYASMINKAIEELNEEGGSSEVSISEYIEGNFEGLPWAHKSYLKHHLNKLCDGGFLVLSTGERYSMPLFSEVKEKGLIEADIHGNGDEVKEKGLIEADIHGNGDEHSTILCEVQALRENLGRKVQADQEQCNTVIANPSRDKYLLDEYRDDTGINVLSLEHHYHGAELMVTPKKSVSSGIKTRKKEAMKWADRHTVIVCGLPAKLPDPREPRRCTTRNRMKSKRNQTSLIPDRIEYPSSKLHQHQNQVESKIIDGKESKWPSWVQSLLQTRFFGECKIHPNTKKCVHNFYCLNCISGPVCALCVKGYHEDHNVIRIRRTPYEDTVNVATIQKYLDISGLHLHKINASSSSMVSLKRMAPSRSRGTKCSHCIRCNRHVPNPFCYCSLSCKYKQEMDAGAPSIVN